MFSLETDTFSTTDATSRVQIGAYTATRDGTLQIGVRLTGLNAAAATIDLDVTVTPSGGSEEQAEFFSDTKRDSSDTSFRRAPAFAIDVDSGDVVKVYAKSSNASDTSIGGDVTFRDGRHADVQAIEGSATIDGVSLTSLLEALLTNAAGETSLTDNGDGTKTLVFTKQDGATTKISWTFDASGQRTGTTIA